jgi:hypothetical protein
MEKKFILATLVILFFVLMGLGSVLSEQCVDVGGCRQCWKTTPAVVQSELCGENRTCLAQPQDQQNNAIVDAVLCGCGRAKSINYADPSMNQKIEDVVNQYTRYNITVNEICEQPGVFLTKRSYT